MPRLRYVLVFLILGLIVTGAVFLLTWDIPPPSATIEIVIPDDRFAR
jgi:hypothetical protein